MLTQGFQKDDIEKITRRSLTDWTDEDYFAHFFTCTFHHILWRFDAHTEKTITEENIDQMLDGLSALNEAFPQHYGMPTSALDWTYNPHIALYFALSMESNNQLFIYKGNAIAPFFSIYAVKIIEPESCPIKMAKNENDPFSKFNERKKRQEGTFTYFSKPVRFYLQNGRYPSINDYIKKQDDSFNLTNFNIPLNAKNIEAAYDIFSRHGINHDFLYPAHDKTLITEELLPS